jgi:hypothetical protein
MADKEKAKHIRNLRNRLQRGTASLAEKAELELWDSQKRRGRKPKYLTSGAPTDTASGNAGAPPTSEASAASDSTRSPPISVHSNLPGMDGGTVSAEETNLPPLNVDPTLPGIGTAAQNTDTSASGAANTNQSSSSTTGQTHGHSASNASTSGSAPKMTSAEAAANGQEVANMLTGFLAELNNYTVVNGGNGMPPPFFLLFNKSCARMCAKYAGNFAEEDFDMAIVVGASGYVGYNAWRTHKKLQKEGKDKASVERHSPTAAPDAKQGPPPPVVPIRANGALLPKHEPTVGEIINPNGNRVY